MAYTPSIAPMTLLDAVNALLTSGGERPVKSLVTVRPDVEAATSLILEASREVQAEGWNFNTEIGYGITSTTTLPWTNADGSNVNLYVFPTPQNLLSFKVTQTAKPNQYELDLVSRPPQRWLGGSSVLYDRSKNRDGLEVDTIYIDPVWLLDFNDLPQLAKSLITIRAMRRYLGQIVGDNAAADRKERDEMMAFRALKREHGARDRYNLFANLGTSRHFGGRYFDQSTIDDRRVEVGGGQVNIPDYEDVDTVTVEPNSFVLDALDPADDPVVTLEIGPNTNVVLDAPTGVAVFPIQQSITIQFPTVTLDGIGDATANDPVATLTIGPSNTVVLDAPSGSGNMPFPQSITLGSTASSLTYVAPVATVTVSLSATPIAIGATSNATAVVRDASSNVLTGRTITWSSSNPSVATVNASTGVVSAVAAGTANIFATCEGVNGSIQITVNAVAVNSIVFYPTGGSPGDDMYLSLSGSGSPTSKSTVALPKDVSNNTLTGRTITYSSTNTSVATINSSGVVTAVGLGTCTVIATCEGKTNGIFVATSS